MKLNWAERWVVNNPLRIVMEKVEIRWMEKASGGRRLERVLEVGAGRGAAAPLIMDRFAPDLLITTDLDPAMLARGRTYLTAFELDRANLCAADSLSLPFRDGVLDAVFGFGIIHHVVDWRAALAEIARVLRPGGTYFLEELYPSLYQNALTRHFLLHPTLDRFRSDDLHRALSGLDLHITAERELRLIGIAAVIRKGNALIP